MPMIDAISGRVLTDGDYRLARVLRYVNHSELPPELHGKRAETSDEKVRRLIRAAIGDLSEYGRRLYEIQKRVKKRRRIDRFGLLPLETMASVPSLTALNNSFNASNLAELARMFSAHGLGLDSVSFYPPAFFQFSLRANGDTAGQRAFDFLFLLSRIDPRRWGICGTCSNVFVSQRRRGDTSYCSDQCRHTARNKARAALARDRRKKGLYQ